MPLKSFWVITPDYPPYVFYLYMEFPKKTIFLKIICCEETGMNRSGSLPKHENLTLYEGLPPHGLPGVQRAGSF